MEVYDGGSAVSTMVNDNGNDILMGGTDRATTVYAGGFLIVSSGSGVAIR